MRCERRPRHHTARRILLHVRPAPAAVRNGGHDPGPAVSMTPPMPPEAGAAESAVGVLGLVLQQLGKTEERLAAKLDENAKAAAGRWKAHDDEHHELVTTVESIAKRLESHLEAEERQQLVFDSRVGPIKRTGVLIFREWRTIAVVALVLLDIVGQVAKVFS